MERKNIRIKEYDYKSDGYYFITICTAKNKPLLERYNKIAEEHLFLLQSKIGGLKVDYYVIMPTHIHLIVILEDAELSLGEIIRRYKAFVTKETGVKPFWEWNYYEHIIRDEKALNKIREYIMLNPLKEKIRFEEIYDYKNCAINRRL